MDEKTVNSEIVEAEDAEAAISKARDYYGMGPEKDDINGAGRWNHYLMAEPLEDNQEG